MENLTNEELEFLQQSNYIENERSPEALEDAIAAWQYAKQVRNMTLPDVLEIHRLLLARLNPEIAGRIRDGDVWIGGRRKVFVTQDLIENRIRDMLEDIRNEHWIDPEACRTAHVTFEDIHPFFDGNGRVGRILMNWHRLKLKLPLLIIHEGEEQMEYYTWFE